MRLSWWVVAVVLRCDIIRRTAGTKKEHTIKLFRIFAAVKQNRITPQIAAFLCVKNGIRSQVKARL